MSRSEFRWNKKRKHYSYLFKDKGQKRMNFLLYTKGFLEIKRKNGKIKQINFIPLTKRPDGKDGPTIYIEPKIYLDETFSDKKYPWNFDVNDKRKIKRLKKQKLDKENQAENLRTTKDLSRLYIKIFETIL